MGTKKLKSIVSGSFEALLKPEETFKRTFKMTFKKRTCKVETEEKAIVETEELRRVKEVLIRFKANVEALERQIALEEASGEAPEEVKSKYKLLKDLEKELTQHLYRDK